MAGLQRASTRAVLMALWLGAAAWTNQAPAQEEPVPRQGPGPLENPQPGGPQNGRPGQDRDDQTPEGFFRELDGNLDGFLTQAEAERFARDRFQRAVKIGDENHDGRLNQGEFIRALAHDHPGPDGAHDDQGRPNDPADILQGLDRNHDGKIYASEVGPEHQQNVIRLLRMRGKSEDGYLTLEDIASSQRQGGSDPRPNGSRGPGSDQGPQAPRPQGSLDPERIFKTVDRNRDGVIDRTEAEVAPPGPRAGVLQMLTRMGKSSITHAEFLGSFGPGSRGDSPTVLPTKPDGRLDVDTMFAKLDRDRNGRLTQAELTNSMLDGFIPVLEQHGRLETGITKDELAKVMGPREGRSNAFGDDPRASPNAPPAKPPEVPRN